LPADSAAKCSAERTALQVPHRPALCGAFDAAYLSTKYATNDAA
jgi:hypothetical protein